MKQPVPEPEVDLLLQTLRTDREPALAQYFEQVRPRLKRIVRFRLDYHLSGRVAESDVLQEAYLRAARNLDRFLEKPHLPVFIWLRLELQQMLHDIHRQHVQAGKRDVRRERRWGGHGNGCETSMAIAAQIVGRSSSPSRLVEKAEQIALVQQTLEQLPVLDREIIALRHFEELSNVETANVLGIEPSAASKRYLRALTRLKQIMNQASEHDRQS